MPRYEIRTLDVWGNARDGFEVNQTFHEGYLNLARNELEGEGWDQRLVEALVDEGALGAAARELLEEEQLQVEDLWGGGRGGGWREEGSSIEIAELVQQPDEELEEPFEAWRPILVLGLMMPATKPHQFWARTLFDEDGTKEKLVLAVDAFQQIWSCLRIDRADWFYTWSIPELRRAMHNAQELHAGVDSTGDQVYLYADEFEEVLVALDAYLEQGKPNSKFLRGLRGRR